MPERRIALITGAGSNIGRAAAVALAHAGFDVALAGRRPDALAETTSLVAGSGATTIEVPTDVRDPASVDGLFAAVVQAFGRLDVLFNNAGVFGSREPLEDVSAESFADVIATNLTGAFLCTKKAFEIIRDQEPRGGRIINNGSISAYSPRPNTVAYTASKHGIRGLTKSTSLEGRRFDIACGQIDIGNATDQPLRDGENQMDVAHVGDALVYMANLPVETNVLFLTVMPSKMPFVGRG